MKKWVGVGVLGSQVGKKGGNREGDEGKLR